MTSLFEHSRQKQIEREAPLAARARPRTFDEFVGQEEIVGAGRLLRRAIETDRLFSSLIFWGPPGTGKTTLAMIIAEQTQARFETLNAVLDGIGDLREIVKAAREQRGMYGKRTLLLVDEIHRWNKAQQDGLLPVVEDGTVTLIGATTENPYFSIISPLISRSRIFRFKPLTPEQIRDLLERAMRNSDWGYGRPRDRDHRRGAGSPGAHRRRRRALRAQRAGAGGRIDAAGRGRRRTISLAVAEESIQHRALQYDRSGDEHYDTISAFIKSIRGTDPDAALYYLAKMVEAGEDPRFILRRLLIWRPRTWDWPRPWRSPWCSGCAQAFEWVGMPEGQYHLAEATLYLATAPKSNTVGAYWKAKEELEKRGYRPPPIYIRDTHTLLREEKASAAAYKYPHNYPSGWVQQRYLPQGVKGGWYKPKRNGFEARIQERLKKMKERGNG